ncbi:MAG: methyl-accepting chemotaxis protein, partial [Mariprofundales bacterium]|nr:methyl-accepting chemotaxis protein [Mariprofundales bacterium]
PDTMVARLRMHYWRVIDRFAMRVDFRIGVYCTVALLLLLLLAVPSGALLFSHSSDQDHEHMRRQIVISNLTNEMMTTSIDWFRIVVPPSSVTASARGEAAEGASTRFYDLIRQELDWYSDHPVEGVDYAAQLQEIATLQERLLEGQRLPGGAIVQLINDFDHLHLLLSGMMKQQLYDIEQQQAARVEVTELRMGLFVVISCGVILLLIALLLLIYRSSYTKLRASMDVVRSWVAGSFRERVTDAALLDRVVDHDSEQCVSRYPFSAISHDINTIGDIIQIFLLETSASLEAMAAGNTNRRIDVDGFPWRIRQVAVDINANIDRVVDIYMKADQEQGRLDEFQRDLTIISQSLGAVADSMGMHGMELADAAQVMASRVETAESEGLHVQEGMDKASGAVDAISQSISEVAGQVREASSITSDAVEQAQETRTTIAQLEQASDKIGNMVDLITTIARQTQMLSMNATIEAARAGEAGRGFAVVASEVKDLATQTSRAAQDISASIAEIQGTTQASMEVIQKVAETIERINAITVDIERNAAQQEEAAKEIAGNVQQVKHATTVMGENLTEVRSAASVSNSNVETMNSATQELRKSIDELDSVVTNYVGEVESDDIELF